MSRDPLLRELFSGFIRLHILFHAAGAPVYGAALMAELGQHGYRVGPGTLYPVLHRLERLGCVRRDERVIAGRRRKYYRATAAGRRALASAEAQLRELVTEVLSTGLSRGRGRGVKPRLKDGT